MQEVPAIFSPLVKKVVLRAPGRLLALLISVTCLSVMVTAARLQPSPTGMGTHTQMGLEPCPFFRQTGLPCPSCGMTTSFAWFVRGNILASFYIQPMGAVLAVLTVVIFWGGIYAAATGRPVYQLVSIGPTRYYFPALFAWAIIAWAWKIFIHLHGLDGWRA